jgi:hypothetical protein
MRVSLRSLKLVVGVAATLLWTVTAVARAPVPVAQDVGDVLSGPVRAGEHVVVPRLALDDGSEISLDLEAFEVFTPGAMIVEYTDKGPRRLAPPADRYFRGTVIGDLDSVVVLASGSKLRGFVQTRGAIYAIAPDRNVYGDDLPDPVSRLRRVDPERDRPADVPLFHCDTESLPTPPADGITATAFGMSIPVRPLWTSTVYTINLAIETDYELRQKFTSTDAEIRYLGDLTAAASAIYWRDVKTVFQIGTVHLWTTSGDPWSATDPTSALLELGDYWHANYSGVARTTVHFVSGKNLGGGIAWVGVLCRVDFAYGSDWGGAYGLSGNHSGIFSTTNPAYYWDILGYTHEIGHNFSSPHTHCYPTIIDHCYNLETPVPPCYNGTPCQNGTGDPCNIGTIMSYCHLRTGGYNNITLAFGQQGQLSQQVLDTMRGYVESKAACLTLLAAAPTVTGVSPSSGSTGGGTSVTISGTGFQYYATVTIGGVPATNVAWPSSTSITAVTGAHAASTVDVVVQNPDSQSGSLTNGYTYGTPTWPVVTSVYPNFGPVAGGTGIAITGSLFVNGATVTLGGTSATGVTFVNSTTLTATTAAHTTGSVNVVVQNPDAQTGTLVNGYFYGPPTTTGALFYPLTPCRVLDTRNATGPLGGPVLAAGATRSFTVVSTCAIPSNAKTLSVNVTITGPTANGELRVFSGNGTLPSTSSISFRAGQTRANNAHVLLATDGTGSFKVQNNSTGTVHFLVDVNGYYR